MDRLLCTIVSLNTHSGVIHNTACSIEPFVTATKSVPNAQSSALFLAHSHVIPPISPLQVCSVRAFTHT